VKKIVMVMGVQRSGTSALFFSLAKDDRFNSFNESADNAFFYNYFLRPERVLGPLLIEIEKPVLLKPISETKRRSLDDVFEEYAAYDVSALYIYRDPVNTYYSSNARWPEAVEPYLEKWIRRNQYLLALHPRFRPRVAVIRYEDLIADPNIFREACDFVGIKGTYSFRADSCRGRKSLPEGIQKQIDQWTQTVLSELDHMRKFRPHSIQIN
jgi:hypothetical protein